jgi:hypothetical protein
LLVSLAFSVPLELAEGPSSAADDWDVDSLLLLALGCVSSRSPALFEPAPAFTLQAASAKLSVIVTAGRR